MAFDNLGWFSAVIHLLDRHNGTVSAAATVAICGLTVGLLRTSGKQARLTRETIELTRAEFIASHPPKLVLLEVVMEAEWIVAYTLANVGGSPATIRESWVLAEYPNPNLPMRSLRSSGHTDLGCLVFAAGEIKDLTYPLIDEISYYLNFPDGGRLDPETAYCRPNNLHFTGVIRFADNEGALRRLVFRRRWDHALKRFGLSLEPENEYVE